MGRWLLILVLAPAAAFAQQPKENQFVSGFKMPLLNTGLLASTAPRQRPAEISAQAAERCAIPLIRVPINPKMDEGIRHELKPPLDNMPTVTGLPACK